MVMVGCKPAKTYTVTFDIQGHGQPIPSQTVAEGGKVVKPEDPKADNYKFDGWYKEAGWKNAWDFDKDIVKSDITLFAKWVSGRPGEKTVEEILKTVDFPTEAGNGWKNENQIVCFENGGRLWFQTPGGEGDKCDIPLPTFVTKSEDGNNYVYDNNGFKVTFILQDDVLKNIRCDKGPDGFVGQYGPRTVQQ